MDGGDDLIARLRATFIGELDEQVAQLNDGLLRLERYPGDQDTIRTLFRAAHTVKGAARVAGVPLVEQACHAMESVFAAARDGRRRLAGDEFSLLFGILDALAEAGRRLRAAEPLEGSTLEALLPRLMSVADDVPAGAPRAARTAPPADPAPAPIAVSAPPPPTPVADKPTPARGAEPGAAGEELVRVRADRLDELLAAAGELIVATGRAVAALGQRSEDARRLDAATESLYDVVHNLRLRPFSDVCAGLPRAVRDVAQAGGKEATLRIEGEQVEADRMVMDALREPLLHLVRNAVDHGIEKPAEREQRGKDRAGQVVVSAELSGGRLLVRVADDGAGVDEDALRQAFRAAGQPVPEGRAELAEALLAGGVSSRSEATAISGRGVGVDLARSALERIGGNVDVRWERGRGTVFTLECPPTPATVRALLLRVGPHAFAIPTGSVERLLRLSPSDVKRSEGRSVVMVNGEALALHSLATLLGPPLEARPLLDGRFTGMVVSAGSRRAVLVIDEALDEDEIVIRPLEVDDGAIPAATGAAVLPTGSIALVLAAAPLLYTAARAGTGIAPAVAPETASPRRRVLVADDSITTRTLEQSVLESAGYAVTTAVNGEDAWRQLEAGGADLLVADVEMPRMDGITLCRRIRASEAFRDLPIILVTGLGSDEDRARGLEAGADAYIVKSSFDQATLLDAVQQLIGDE